MHAGQTGACMPSFAFVEPAYGINDEHPGSGQSILSGQAQVAKMMNGLMTSPAWKDSVFFLSYDEGGGPFDHVPPVPNHSNDFTSPAMGIAASVSIPDISSYCGQPGHLFPVPGVMPVRLAPRGRCRRRPCTATCRPRNAATIPATTAGDDAAVSGFAAQLGFRLPNMVISPFTRRHYVSHSRWITRRSSGSWKIASSAARRLVPRRRQTPSLLPDESRRRAASLTDFFDFANVPWSVPPSQDTSPPPVPTPVPPTGRDVYASDDAVIARARAGPFGSRIHFWGAILMVMFCG